MNLYYPGNYRTDEQLAQMMELEAAGVCLFCPEHLPTLLAVVQALTAPEANCHSTTATTNNPAQVIVVNTGGEIRAFQGICTHEYFELDKGFLTGNGSRGANGRPAGTLTCALHLSRFDLADGEALDPPAEIPLAAYPVSIEDGRVVIEVPDGPLPVNE